MEARWTYCGLLLSRLVGSGKKRLAYVKNAGQMLQLNVPLVKSKTRENRAFVYDVHLAGEESLWLIVSFLGGKKYAEEHTYQCADHQDIFEAYSSHYDRGAKPQKN